MNEEPGWLRNDAAAHLRETEQESATAERTRRVAARRADPGLEAEASRALAAGQPERLRPGAVLHLQRAAGNAGVARLLGEDREPDSPVKGVVGHGAGTPLDESSRERMEASFGESFADVRVHTGGLASASARAVDAHAYTVGNEIVLGDGQAPGSPAHERTLAHELAHVVQQRSGPVEATPTAGGISVSDPADRFERAAETTADAVVRIGRAPNAGATGTGASIQRQEEPEEEEMEEVQELAIQRQEAPEEEEMEEVQELAIQRQEEPGEEEMEEVQELAIQRHASNGSGVSFSRP